MICRDILRGFQPFDLLRAFGYNPLARLDCGWVRCIRCITYLLVLFGALLLPRCSVKWAFGEVGWSRRVDVEAP